MHFTIPVHVEEDNGRQHDCDAHFSAPDGHVNIIMAEPGLEITCEPKPLIEAIRRSLLDELGLL